MKPDYATYCKKYLNHREICENPNEFQQRNEIPLKDAILFVRCKSLEDIEKYFEKRKLPKLTEKGITNANERVTFSPEWITKSKHNSMMISTQDNGSIIYFGIAIYVEIVVIYIQHGKTIITHHMTPSQYQLQP